MTDTQPSTFLASVGPRLLRFSLDVHGALQLQDEITLPSPVHYAWPHPTQRVLVVGCSRRWFTPRDEGHLLAVVDLPEQGPMRLRGTPVPLRSRPIHLTLDGSGRYVLALFNDPPGIQVHALGDDGSIGAEVLQPSDLDLGPYAHQVRVFPGDAWVLVAARGNNARAGRAEDPGSLRRYAFEQGRLTPVQVVAPAGGVGFGPRHLDFHPTLPCIYVSVERQNELHVYRHRNGVIDAEPSQVLTTLAPRRQGGSHQYAGAVHVHPLGRQVYVANRDAAHESAGAHVPGDNTLALFDIDAAGAVAAPRHVDLDAFHVRTFSLRPPWLVAASQVDVILRDAHRKVPASLGVFRLEPDGGLRLAQRTLLPSGDSMVFWCGFPAAYGSRWT